MEFEQFVLSENLTNFFLNQTFLYYLGIVLRENRRILWGLQSSRFRIYIKTSQTKDLRLGVRIPRKTMVIWWLSTYLNIQSMFGPLFQNLAFTWSYINNAYIGIPIPQY